MHLLGRDFETAGRNGRPRPTRWPRRGRVHPGRAVHGVGTAAHDQRGGHRGSGSGSGPRGNVGTAAHDQRGGHRGSGSGSGPRGNVGTAAHDQRGGHDRDRDHGVRADRRNGRPRPTRWPLHHQTDQAQRQCGRNGRPRPTRWPHLEQGRVPISRQCRRNGRPRPTRWPRASCSSGRMRSSVSGRNGRPRPTRWPLVGNRRAQHRGARGRNGRPRPTRWPLGGDDLAFGDTGQVGTAVYDHEVVTTPIGKPAHTHRSRRNGGLRPTRWPPVRTTPALSRLASSDRVSSRCLGTLQVVAG